MSADDDNIAKDFQTLKSAVSILSSSTGEYQWEFSIMNAIFLPETKKYVIQFGFYQFGWPCTLSFGWKIM